MSDTKVLITGSSGYIGEHLILAMRESGFDGHIIGIDRRPAPASLSGKIDHHTFDLATDDYASLEIENVDTIFHLAAAKSDWGESDEDYHRDNVVATQNLIEASSSWLVNRWVFFSTVSTIGASAVELDESSSRNPSGAYGTTKYECEELFRNVVEERGTPVLTIMPSAVFGPSNPDSTNIFRLIDAIERRRFVMIGDGSTRKTTSYIHNLVAATLFAYELHTDGYEDFIYVDQPLMSTADLVAFIRKRLGKRATKLHVPLAFVEKPAQLFDVIARVTKIDLPITADRIQKFCRDTTYSSAKIRERGFVQPFDPEAALAATVDWHVSR